MGKQRIERYIDIIIFLLLLLSLHNYGLFVPVYQSFQSVKRL